MRSNETNSKFEIRNPKQIQMANAQNPKPFAITSVARKGPACLDHWNFEIVSDFESGISDFPAGAISDL